MSLDRSHESSSNNNKSTAVLNKYIEDTLCVDAWRDRNPEARTYTYCKFNQKFVGSRIDYVLIDLSIIAWLTKIDIKPGFRSDHSAVVLTINPFTISRGRGLWRLNNQVLFEKEYVSMINNLIEKHEENQEKK